MSEIQRDSGRPQYRWPWFVLAAVVLGVALAIAWMSVAVRRTRQLRDPNAIPPPAGSVAPLPMAPSNNAPATR